MNQNRRAFIKLAGLAAAFSQLPNWSYAALDPNFFEISLAEWSFQKSLFAGKMTNMDFPSRAVKDFDIRIVEYVSVFFNGKENDQSYLAELRKRTADLGIQNHLIMVDGAGDLGDLNPAKRAEAIDQHRRWLDAAKSIGCTQIRVNASGHGSMDDVKQSVIIGLGELTVYAEKQAMNVIVENHGGYSSNGKWLADVMKGVNNSRCGTLPDFGNFQVSASEKYDLYQGVKELLPYAKGISAKTFKFDKQGNEPDIDYDRLFRMIKDSGFKGIVGIEWEGNSLSEVEGIRATKKLLERVRKQFG